MEAQSWRDGNNQDLIVIEMTESKNITTSFKNLKWWQATIMIVLILMASGFAAWSGATFSMNIDLQNRVTALEDSLSTTWNPTFYTTQLPYDFVISHLETYYTLQNGITGKLQWFSTNKTAVQVAAIGNLTSGTVYCKNVTWNDNVEVPSGIIVIEDYNGVRRYITLDGDTLQLPASFLMTPAEWNAIIMQSRNSSTGIEIILTPKGTALTYQSELVFSNKDYLADPANAEVMAITALGTNGYQIKALAVGNGSYRPLLFDGFTYTRFATPVHINMPDPSLLFQNSADGQTFAIREYNGELQFYDEELDKVVFSISEASIVSQLSQRITTTYPSFTLDGTETNGGIITLRESQGDLQFLNDDDTLLWTMEQDGAFTPATPNLKVGNEGYPIRPFIKTFNTVPTINDLEIGEMALGNGTGAAGADEIFIKVTATHISRFVADGIIT
jgi:hypothetical protein